jgi:hypothetical protein
VLKDQSTAASSPGTCRWGAGVSLSCCRSDPGTASWLWPDTQLQAQEEHQSRSGLYPVCSMSTWQREARGLGQALQEHYRWCYCKLHGHLGEPEFWCYCRDKQSSP